MNGDIGQTLAAFTFPISMNPDELERYGRHLQLEAFGEPAQQSLLKSHAVIIGLGGLGSAVAYYLAAAGVGKITLVDFDVVELSNLQRQIIHFSADIGQFKVDSAAARLQALNPGIELIPVRQALNKEELQSLAKATDVFIDCSDNFSTRFELNQVCVASKTPLVSGSVIRYEGQVCVFDSRDSLSPCYQCLYQPVNEGEGETCSQTGVLASAPGMIGTIQATEAIKILAKLPVIAGKLLLMDAKTMEWRSISVPKDPACLVCNSGQFPA